MVLLRTRLNSAMWRLSWKRFYCNKVFYLLIRNESKVTLNSAVNFCTVRVLQGKGDTEKKLKRVKRDLNTIPFLIHQLIHHYQITELFVPSTNIFWILNYDYHKMYHHSSKSSSRRGRLVNVDSQRDSKLQSKQKLGKDK